MIRAAVFDAYGTLLDVHGAMRAHASRIPGDWERLSADWRGKQLEYSWIRSLTGPAHHKPFWELTKEALEFVSARAGIDDPELKADLLDVYRKLPAYPEVPEILSALRGARKVTAILSNGDPGMLADAVGAGRIGHLLDAVISIEDVGVFKPDRRVYALAVDRLGVPAEEMAFVSSNAWDAQGALAFGMKVFWVNRARQPEEYGLGTGATVIADLSALPTLLA